MTPLEFATVILKEGHSTSIATNAVASAYPVPPSEAARIVEQAQANLDKPAMPATTPVEAQPVPAQLAAPTKIEPEPVTTTNAEPVTTPAEPIERVTFLDRAKLGLRYGIPIVPAPPRMKGTVIGAKAATTDLAVIERWNREEPNYNSCLVAQNKPGGVWVLDCDSPDVKKQIEKDTDKKLPDTFTVQSSSAGHRYFRQNEESLKRLSNFAVPEKDEQGNPVKDEDGKTKEFFSVRWDNMYCVGPLSVHPSGAIYKIVRDIEPIEAPPWLIDWLLAQHQEKKLPVTASSDGPRVPRGSHDNELIKIAGKLRRDGLEEDEIYPVLVRNVEERFDDYGKDYLGMCAAKAKSACRYAKGDNSIQVLHGGVPVEQIAQEMKAGETPEPAPIFSRVPYPVFPRWIFEQPHSETGRMSSLYTGLVKPWCDLNSRYPEFMFVPAMALMLNYLNGKVRIEWNDTPLSIFMMVIGKHGVVIKSSSVVSAILYFNKVNICDYASSVRTADGKSLVWTAGSAEGFGIKMGEKKCKNSVLFYDEFTTAASKARIEASSLGSNLLTLYESGLFQNDVKSEKQSFSFPPNSYVTSFIACNTDENFAENWAALATGKKGMDDRFFFLLQPEHLDPLKPKHDVDCSIGALETRKLVDQAVMQGVYKFVDKTRIDSEIETLGNRAELRAEKWALGFAVDFGLDVIDEDCVERALELTRYELAVKAYLGAREAETREASIQIKIREVLTRAGGSMPVVGKGSLTAVVKPERWGTSLFSQAYLGLIKHGITREEGAGTRSDPRRVVLLRPFSEDEGKEAA